MRNVSTFYERSISKYTETLLYTLLSRNSERFLNMFYSAGCIYRIINLLDVLGKYFEFSSKIRISRIWEFVISDTISVVSVPS